jgi:hypothetical protein
LRPVARELRIGSVRDDDLEVRRRSLPQRAAGCAVLAERRRRRSAYRTCADCAAVADCVVCPLAISATGADDPGRVPDIHCLFQRLTRAHRYAFVRGSAVTSLLRELDLHGAARRRFERMFMGT